MNISSNIEFVRYFAKEYQFFTVMNELYLIYDTQVIPFESEKAKHIVNVSYQDKMNKLAPSNNFLMQNIKSRVLLNDIAHYDKFHQRFIEVSDGVVCDLVNSNTLVAITSDGYQLIERSSSDYLNLLPSNTALSLPLPESSSESLIDMLEELTNFRNRNELLLFATWLVSLCFPELSTPVLILLGEQGSGKSYTSELVKSIVDPSSIKKQHSIKSVQDFALLVSKSYVSVIDNLSHISDEISDAMCQTVSDGQFTTRKLYTTNEVTTINMKAKLVINGITIMNTKPDLLERSIVLTLDKLDGSSIKGLNTLQRQFNTVLPKLLDQLYLAVSHVLGIIADVRLDNSPRMADFSLYLVAIADYFGVTSKEIMSIYFENIKQVNDIIIDDPVIQALFQVLDNHSNSYTGSATALLNEMKQLRINGLPKAANSLSAKLTRLTSDLKKESIEIEKFKDSNGKRVLRITRSTAIRR